MNAQPSAIFLTGAGGVAIPFLIQHLRSKGFRVIVGDMDPHAPGLFEADKGYVIPPATSSSFLPIIKNICQQENVRIFIPLVDEELEQSCDLEQSGIVVLVPRKPFISLCLDKYALTKELERNGITVPQTFLLHEFTNQLPSPFLIKPRTGRGSRGVALIKSSREFEDYLKSTTYTPHQLLVQEYIAGIEYTVSIVVWRDGNIRAIVPKKIISKKGVTRIAVTQQHPAIDQLCRAIQEKLHIDGPCNVQLRLNHREQPSVFEINPRFSTTITLTIAAGIDEVGLLIDSALGITPPIPIAWKEGIILMRKSVDVFYQQHEFASIQQRVINYMNQKE